MMCLKPELAPSTAYGRYGCRCERCSLWVKKIVRKTQIQRTRAMEKFKRLNPNYWKNWEKNKKLGLRFVRKSLSRYGLTPQEFLKVLRSPCGICGSRKNVGADHNHKTKKFRGPLCQKHNLAVAFLENCSKIELRKIMEWIQK